MTERKIFSRKVSQRIPPEYLSDEDKQKPEIAGQLESQGYYEMALDLDPEGIQVLEALVDKGYVKRRRTTVFKVWMTDRTWLARPTIGPYGRIGLSGKRGFSSFSYVLEEEEYNRVVDGYKELKDEVDEGKHPNIEFIGFGAELDYRADVYQVGDDFFDAVYLHLVDGELKVWLTRPFLTSRKGKDTKNWDRLDEIDPEVFFAGAKVLRPVVTDLDWKQDSIGAIIFDDKGYWLLPRDSVPVESGVPERRLMEDLQEDFQRIRNEDEIESLKKAFRENGRELFELIGECNLASQQNPRCPISDVFDLTAQTVKIGARLPDRPPVTREQAGGVAVDLTKLLHEATGNGQRIQTVALKDVLPLLRVVKELRHHESHDRELGKPREVKAKQLRVGEYYQEMIGNSVPIDEIHWLKVGNCLLVLSRYILREVLTSIRAM